MNDLRMPLLEDLINTQERIDDTVILHINHCMNNSFYFSAQLKRIFHDVVFIAVPYNDRGLPENLEFTAYHAEQNGNSYCLKRSNCAVETPESEFLQATLRLIELAFENELLQYARDGKKILVIEDGGYHYSVIGKMTERFPILKEALIGAVEQTTAGTKSSQQSDLFYPVLSVARSIYKIRVEAYFVANRVVNELERMLHEMDFFIDFHSFLILGYGVLGRSIALCLKPYHTRISVWDIDDRINEAAAADGFAVWDGKFTDDMIVLGNVGKPSFTKEMLDSFLQSHASRLLMASSSSKQVEFENIFPELQDCEQTKSRWSASYRFPNKKEILLFAEGYPINFYDETADSLTFGMIDPVFSEIFLLALYWGKQKGPLAPDPPFENRTYMLGVDKALDAYADERVLIKQWMKENSLYFDLDSFNIHPKEQILQQINPDWSESK